MNILLCVRSHRVDEFSIRIITFGMGADAHHGNRPNNSSKCVMQIHPSYPFPRFRKMCFTKHLSTVGERSFRIQVDCSPWEFLKMFLSDYSASFRSLCVGWGRRQIPSVFRQVERSVMVSLGGDDETLIQSQTRTRKMQTVQFIWICVGRAYWIPQRSYRTRKAYQMRNPWTAPVGYEIFRSSCCLECKTI